MRPSHGHLSHDGFLASFPRFDTPTFFGRELEKCKQFAEAWYGRSLPLQTSNGSVGLETAFHHSARLISPQKPFAIIYASDYMKIIGNQQQLKLIDEFVTDLEDSLGVKHERVSFDEAWESNPPSEANGESLEEYMKDASRDSFFYVDYHNFDPFREDYKQKYGRDAYISPPVRWQW